MLGWALTFFILALIADIFGFGGIASEAAKITFIVAIVLFAIWAVIRLMRDHTPTLR